MTAKKKRLEALEVRHARRVSSHSSPDTLAAEAQRVCLALPEDLQAKVQAGGARALADLIESWWEGGASPDLEHAALRAYRAAFEGGQP
jgi:hypothetical protein